MNRTADIKRALTRMGWQFTEKFQEKYMNDSYVYNLVNAVVALTEENERLYKQLTDGSR